FQTASSPPVKLGRSSQPNHTSGAFAAELNHQPLSGIARISTYSARCNPCAARRCHCGIAGMSAGRFSVVRHALQKNTNARIVMPIDLCKSNTRTLAGVTPICTIDNPMTPCTMISAATSQWNARTSAPQPASVLRSCMRFLHRLLVIAFGGAIELGFDFEANRHFGTDGFRERGHAELRAIELRASGKPRDRFEPEQRRAHAVDGEIDLHRQRDAVQR